MRISREISRNLKTKLSDIKIIRFADSEVYCEIKENMRGKDVFLIQAHLTQLIIISWSY